MLKRCHLNACELDVQFKYINLTFRPKCFCLKAQTYATFQRFCTHLQRLWRRRRGETSPGPCRCRCPAEAWVPGRWTSSGRRASRQRTRTHLKRHTETDQCELPLGFYRHTLRAQYSPSVSVMKSGEKERLSRSPAVFNTFYKISKTSSSNTTEQNESKTHIHLRFNIHKH